MYIFVFSLIECTPTSHPSFTWKTLNMHVDSWGHHDNGLSQNHLEDSMDVKHVPYLFTATYVARLRIFLVFSHFSRVIGVWCV